MPNLRGHTQRTAKPKVKKDHPFDPLVDHPAKNKNRYKVPQSSSNGMIASLKSFFWGSPKLPTSTYLRDQGGNKFIVDCSTEGTGNEWDYWQHAFAHDKFKRLNSSFPCTIFTIVQDTGPGGCLHTSSDGPHGKLGYADEDSQVQIASCLDEGPPVPPYLNSTTLLKRITDVTCSNRRPEDSWSKGATIGFSIGGSLVFLAFLKFCLWDKCKHKCKSSEESRPLVTAPQPVRSEAVDHPPLDNNRSDEQPILQLQRYTQT